MGLAAPTVAGAAIGTLLLLLTSNQTFELIVPALVTASCPLLLFQPQLTPHISLAGNEPPPLSRRRPALSRRLSRLLWLRHRHPGARPARALVAVSMQRLNALKIPPRCHRQPLGRDRLGLPRPGALALRRDPDGGPTAWRPSRSAAGARHLRRRTAPGNRDHRIGHRRRTCPSRLRLNQLQRVGFDDGISPASSV
jgi:hypothetical protein